MKTTVASDPESVAALAAARIAHAARDAVARRGHFCVAFSGGSTPRYMFDLLVDEQLPWSRTHVFQVDERVAPDDHPDRNTVDLRTHLLDHVPIPPENVHLMPVIAADLHAAAMAYARTLEKTTDGVLDLVHLGLGDDGHTASLPPGDPVLEVNDVDVALTSVPYNGRIRMTLTYPAINRSRHLLWVVTGAAKNSMVQRLLDSDRTIPAGLVSQEHAELVVDTAAHSFDRSPPRPSDGNR